MKFLRVGSFELCAQERTLTAAGKPLDLGARAFDLLLALVEQPGRLVTKAALLERVWPRLVVDENNLPAQIASLRRVLGAGAIRTVQGFGYRLELEVTEVDSGAAAPAAAAATTATSATAAASATTSTPQNAATSSAAAPAATTATAERAAKRLSIPRRVWPDRMGPLVGRGDEVRAVQQLLQHSNLVTVVGISGVGKTRLAQEIFAREASEPGSAVAWVPLGPVNDVQHVASAIALALGLSLPDGVDGFAALCEELENVALLLILDSAEHLGDALATPLATLVSRTQAVRVLVTSQAPLGITGESVYRLPVLAVPAAGVAQTEAATFASVALFAQRAKAADHRFELTAGNVTLVAEICRRLDGIPLALELAAARVPALGLAELLARLDDRFRLLKQKGQHADARHGALHAAFDWSYSLLTVDEQRVFNWLGAFAGSFALPCAATVVAGEPIDTSEAIDLIGRLVDRSLVMALPIDPPRYILLETARHYAVD
jgi:predicted ATPase/DNA-binding winged helix-turn-helix (wHTH) protein